MTEIPEHLLRRSRERREALGLTQPGEAPAVEVPAASAAVEVAADSTPAAAPAASAPAVAAPPAPPPKPPPPHIQAAFGRKRIPWWAMPVLAGLPLWAFVFAFTLEPPSRGDNDPLSLGAQYYKDGACASCHGAGGEGGVGPAFLSGAVVETWPNWRNHLAWINYGSAKWPLPSYGAQGKPFTGQMPAIGVDHGGPLTLAQIALIVRYEREVLGGAEAEEDLVVLTEAIAEGEPVTVDGATVDELLKQAAEPGDGPGGVSEPPPAS